MRTGQPIIGRPAWYDRNAITRINGWQSNNTAPHSRTSRFSFTVPAGKKAFVEYASIYARRSTAASTAGLVQATIEITPSGGGIAVIAEAQLLTNNVGDADRMDVGQGITLNAGDKIEGYTVDASTGGAVNLLVACKITEFDA
jgi:hypothetical protein